MKSICIYSVFLLFANSSTNRSPPSELTFGADRHLLLGVCVMQTDTDHTIKYAIRIINQNMQSISSMQSEYYFPFDRNENWGDSC